MEHLLTQQFSQMQIGEICKFSHVPSVLVFRYHRRFSPRDFSETNFVPSIHNHTFYLHIDDLAKSPVMAGIQTHVYYNFLLSLFLARS